MNTAYSLLVMVRNQPAVLERVLRVIRHRGFELCSLSVPTTEAASFQLVAVVRTAAQAAGHARPELLCKQLDKLVDVESVSYEEQEELLQAKPA